MTAGNDVSDIIIKEKPKRINNQPFQVKKKLICICIERIKLGANGQDKDRNAISSHKFHLTGSFILCLFIVIV